MKLKLALLAGAAPAAALYGAPRPVQIIPSVLPADFAALGLDCTALEKAGCDRIQFDVMDGNFVPNLTFGPDVIAAQRKTTKLMFETQLMVSERCTDAMLPQFTEATKGPNGEPGVVIVHVEACTHIHRSLSNIRAMGGSPSVALNPSTPAEAVENVLDLVDHVLVMTVNPGFGGQAYIPTMTDKIEKIRKWIVDRNLDVDIEVDGRVKIKSLLDGVAISVPHRSTEPALVDFHTGRRRHQGHAGDHRRVRGRGGELLHRGLGPLRLRRHVPGCVC